MTAVFLDPPYTDGARKGDLYTNDLPISDAVRKWAVANGDNPKLRIVLCGYEGEHQMPSTWTKIAWKAGSGYGGQRVDEVNTNGSKERVWFSPHCLVEVE